MYRTSDFKQTGDINRKRLWKFIYSAGSNKKKKKFFQFIFRIYVKKCECESKKERGIKILFSSKKRIFHTLDFERKDPLFWIFYSLDTSFKNFLWKLSQTSSLVILNLSLNSKSHSIDTYYISSFFFFKKILEYQYKNIKRDTIYNMIMLFKRFFRTIIINIITI